MDVRTALKLIILLVVALAGACSENSEIPVEDDTRMLFERMAYPYLTAADGMYYFIGQDADIRIYAADCIDSLSKVEPVTVWRAAEHGMDNIWSPEMVRIDNKWFIYFEADDGNTDNHQIYVIENPTDNPLTGEWIMHGPIITDKEWNFGIHPSTFFANGRQYLVWSGWEHRRAETETQSIFIAEMENPWTLRSDRVMISSPEYEWERQWINPNGSRSAYPIFVNENPEGFVSPDGSMAIVAYSASGIWTPYTSIGLLYADATADLLDPRSWTKLPEPQSPVFDTEGEMVGISNISVITSDDGTRSDMVFQGHNFSNGQKVPRVYVKGIRWTEKSLPDFGFSGNVTAQ